MAQAKALAAEQGGTVALALLVEGQCRRVDHADEQEVSGHRAIDAEAFGLFVRLERDVTEAQLAAITADLDTSPSVESAQYLNKEAVFARRDELVGNNAGDDVGEMTPIFMVVAADQNPANGSLSSLARAIDRWPGVRSVETNFIEVSHLRVGAPDWSLPNDPDVLVQAFGVFGGTPADLDAAALESYEPIDVRYHNREISTDTLGTADMLPETAPCTEAAVEITVADECGLSVQLAQPSPYVWQAVEHPEATAGVEHLDQNWRRFDVYGLLAAAFVDGAYLEPNAESIATIADQQVDIVSVNRTCSLTGTATISSDDVLVSACGIRACALFRLDLSSGDYDVFLERVHSDDSNHIQVADVIDGAVVLVYRSTIELVELDGSGTRWLKPTGHSFLVPSQPTASTFAFSGSDCVTEATVTTIDLCQGDANEPGVSTRYRLNLDDGTTDDIQRMEVPPPEPSRITVTTASDGLSQTVEIDGVAYRQSTTRELVELSTDGDVVLRSPGGESYRVCGPCINSLSHISDGYLYYSQTGETGTWGRARYPFG